jgi:hypothetical protein
LNGSPAGARDLIAITNRRFHARSSRQGRIPSATCPARGCTDFIARPRVAAPFGVSVREHSPQQIVELGGAKLPLRHWPTTAPPRLA